MLTCPPPSPLPTIAARVADLLRRRGETVAVAESSAGGLVAAALLAVPGASAYFRGGAVVYSRRAMQALLGLEPRTLHGLRPESEPFAAHLAERVRELHHASWGLGESGAAGPSDSPAGDPAGRACLAVSGPHAATLTVQTGERDRPANMQQFACELLELFERCLLAADAP
jgi:nicotinamide-nucleotide amidase